MSNRCPATHCGNGSCNSPNEFRMRLGSQLAAVETSAYLQNEGGQIILATLEALLPHLPNIPFHGEGSRKASYPLRFSVIVERTLIVFAAFLREACQHPPPRLVLGNTFELIGPHVGCLLSWKWFCTSSAPVRRGEKISAPTEFLATLLPLYVLALNTELETQLLCAPDVIDALLVLYSAELNPEGPLITKDNCPNLIFVLTVQVRHINSRRFFMDALLALPHSKLLQFANNLGVMINYTPEQAAKTSPNNVEGVTALTAPFENLCYTVNRLTSQAKINEALLERKVLRGIMSLALTMHRLCLNAPRPVFKDRTQHLLTISRWADYYRCQGGRALRKVLSASSSLGHSPLYTLVQRYKGYHGVRIKDENVDLIFLFFTRYMAFPRVFRDLGAALKHMEESHDMSHPIWDSENKTWAFFNVVLGLRRESRRRVIGKSTSRRCLGCYSVVYFSEECQKDVWERVHKRECHQLADEYTSLARERLEFPQRARLEAMVFILLWLNLSNGSSVFQEINALLGQPCATDSSPASSNQPAPTKARSDFAYCIGMLVRRKEDLHGAQPEDKLISTDEDRAKGREMGSLFPEHRFESIVDGIKSSPSGSSQGIGEDLQLLSFVVPSGPMQWHILCIATVPSGPTQSSRLTFGMMQLESREPATTVYPLDDAPCTLKCCQA
ncbi:hypothetical protein BKA70DRAFT_1413970 [Coprinopsis sp. MPI-PUGE-AT-0042]|nr:hypothetical protein BKA70DRAFT_1413970 [Coprinopsis sp. MPI-PUGE-AT-0042]